MKDKYKNNKKKKNLFSSFFFINVFFSLVFSLLIFFLFIRLKVNQNSYQSQFSQILDNFQYKFEKTFFDRNIVKNWLDPQLKSDEKEEFQKYKLSILSQSINDYFNNLLKETQKNIIDQDLLNFITKKEKNFFPMIKDKVKYHLKENPDIKEFSTFELEGKKIFGVKHKGLPDYVFSQEIIENLKATKNILIKKDNDNYLVLLSLVENLGKPYLVIAQSIDTNFFSRILSHLRINDELYYIKDSHNQVLLDNQDVYLAKLEDNQNSSLKIFNSLTTYDEQNLKINLNDNLPYSIGVVVKKNNVWGNTIAISFIMLVFFFSFISIDYFIQLIKSSFFTKKVIEEKTFESSSIPLYNKKYEEITPIPLEQYSLKKEISDYPDNNIE